MVRQKQKQKLSSDVDPPRIPEFKTVEEAADFWDTHSSFDYEDEFEDVDDVDFVPVKRLRIFLEVKALAALTARAEALGIDPAQLARAWLEERISAESAKSV
jgi:hypothetical protein